MTSDHQEDRTLSELAAGLKVEMEAPGLWTRIESALVEERSTRARWRRGLLTIGLAAAVLLMVLPPLLLFKPGEKSALILQNGEARALAREERNLVERIRAIEPQFEEALAGNGSNARHRLEYVDWNLQNCRRTASGNRRNVYVQHALLTCLRKKLEIMMSTLSR